MRLVAVVDPTLTVTTGGKFHGRPVLGGLSGLEKAVEDLSVSAVVLVDSEDSAAEELVRDYLDRVSGLDVFRLSVALERAGGERRQADAAL